ncbi:hypothetical protein [Cyanobium gracile]|nr:hypothetical protein [Cyanobium gracile]
MTSPTSAAISPKLVYVLTTNCRDPYADMVLVSMLSVGLSNPEITTVLVVDTISMEALTASNHKLLEISDSVIAIDTPPGSGVFRSRWMKTQVGHFIQGAVIFIDADTIVRRAIDWPRHFNSGFGAVADAPYVEASEDPHRLQVSVDIGWNQDRTYYNSGFFYYVSSPAMERFFETWHSLWQDNRDRTNNKDQPSFNAAITLAAFDEQELPETFNHQITMSWKDCQRSKVWHFWESSRMPGDILDELTRQSADLPIGQLTEKVRLAISKNTPAAYSNRQARALEFLSIDPELQRKLLIQKSRLSTTEFLRWSLRKLVGR